MVKGWCMQKLQFCHNLLILMFFQTCLTFFCEIRGGGGGQNYNSLLRFGDILQGVNNDYIKMAASLFYF